jgi:hypothetical protein
MLIHNVNYSQYLILLSNGKVRDNSITNIREYHYNGYPYRYINHKIYGISFEIKKRQYFDYYKILK